MPLPWWQVDSNWSVLVIGCNLALFPPSLYSQVYGERSDWETDGGNCYLPGRSWEEKRVGQVPGGKEVLDKGLVKQLLQCMDQAWCICLTVESIWGWDITPKSNSSYLPYSTTLPRVLVGKMQWEFCPSKSGFGLSVRHCVEFPMAIARGIIVTIHMVCSIGNQASEGHVGTWFYL